MRRVFIFGLLITSVCAQDPCAGTGDAVGALDTALEHKDAAASEALLRKLEQSYPGCDGVVLAKARVLASRGENGPAEDAFFQFIHARPKDARGYSGLARLLLDSGDYRRADNFATAALAYEANSDEALITKGQILAMQGRTGEAKEMLRKACELEPNRTEPHFRLGVLLDSTKQYVQAVERFKKVTALNSRDPRAWDYLALNLEPLGQMEKAEAAYRKGLAVNDGPLMDSFLDYNY